MGYELYFIFCAKLKNICIFVLFIFHSKIFYTMTKSQVLNTVRDMPDEFALDALLDKLVLLHKIELAQADVKDGKTLTHEDAKKRIIPVVSPSKPYRLKKNL
jgi:hypothetical protein